MKQEECSKSRKVIIKFLPVQGEGDIAKSRLCSKAARDFDFVRKLK